MRLLNYDILKSSERWHPPEVWYAAAKLKINPEIRKKLGIEFDIVCDDLDALEFAYIDVEGIPVSLMRYSAEPEEIYTLQVDAPQVAAKRRVSVSSFVTSLLRFSWKIRQNDIEWVNTALDAAFPWQSKPAADRQVGPLIGQGDPDTIVISALRPKKNRLEPG
jgi:hypothetical protein